MRPLFFMARGEGSAEPLRVSAPRLLQPVTAAAALWVVVGVFVSWLRSVDGYHGAKLNRYNDVLNRYIYPVNPNVLNMLNTRYVIVNGQAKQYNPFGAAWFVGDVKMVDTPAEALDELEHNDLWETAIVERGDVEGLSAEYSGYILRGMVLPQGKRCVLFEAHRAFCVSS